MLLTNGLMLKFFVKAMQENGAAKATVYNFTINYLSSVRLTSNFIIQIVFGAMFFDENITQRLLLGASFIISGAVLISTCQDKTQEYKPIPQEIEMKTNGTN